MCAKKAAKRNSSSVCNSLNVIRQVYGVHIVFGAITPGVIYPNNVHTRIDEHCSRMKDFLAYRDYNTNEYENVTLPV